MLLGFLKLGPLLLLLGSTSFKLLWGGASFIIGLPLLWSCSSVNLLLLGSGLLQFWVFCTLSSFTLSFYLMSYLIRLLFCCCASSLNLSFFLACLSLAGLPPFIFFVAKVTVLALSPLLFAFLIFMVSATRLVPYAHFGFSFRTHIYTSSFTLFFLLSLSFGSLTFLLPCL